MSALPAAGSFVALPGGCYQVLRCRPGGTGWVYLTIRDPHDDRPRTLYLDLAQVVPVGDR